MLQPNDPKMDRSSSLGYSVESVKNLDSGLLWGVEVCVGDGWFREIAGCIGELQRYGMTAGKMDSRKASHRFSIFHFLAK